MFFQFGNSCYGRNELLAMSMKCLPVCVCVFRGDFSVFVFWKRCNFFVCWLFVFHQIRITFACQLGIAFSLDPSSALTGFISFRESAESARPWVCAITGTTCPNLDNSCWNGNPFFFVVCGCHEVHRETKSVESGKTGRTDKPVWWYDILHPTSFFRWATKWGT